ncbi:hypothetical protein VCRA2123O444_10261 [Vibrio crassostreae]|nr:hypothetical protein VCRA2111O320_140092 [Vibrio crassostreae]CAK1781794.1 hypothetical protein VCRA2113O324_150092 [Vibrio crassostreae]CAK1842701.1 hypothetical protein VCRA2113O409_10205 [Vibrio crassostreae]CAK1850942.1 hypothetical protein VCRA2113O412_10205 [Vibrio crassostreae]CAK1851643.1 hypothetical protein VCRA2113O418_10205 [Vibrio crassostreae]
MPFDLTISNLPSSMNIQASLSITLFMFLDLVIVFIILVSTTYRARRILHSAVNIFY